MAELGKVIHDLPICIDFAESRGYGGLVDVMRDALSLLKAQEFRVMTLEEMKAFRMMLIFGLRQNIMLGKLLYLPQL